MPSVLACVPPKRRFHAAIATQEERGSPEYDSDTAEAVQRRLRQLKKEQRPQQAEGAAPLPERLYDEQREQRQARHSQPERAAQEERRHHSDSLRPSDRRERRRSRSRERRRSRSRERRRSHSRDRRRSRSRSAERHRHHHGASDSRHRRRSRSRERERERDRHYRAQRRSRSPRSRDERRGEERGRASGRPDGGGGGGAPAVGSGLQKLDFEALIPGYSAMTAPQVWQHKQDCLHGGRFGLCSDTSVQAASHAGAMHPKCCLLSAEAQSQDAVSAGAQRGQRQEAARWVGGDPVVECLGSRWLQLTMMYVICVSWRPACHPAASAACPAHLLPCRARAAGRGGS